MNVFLTGASGFVGREIVPQILAAGHRVRILARDGQGWVAQATRLSRSATRRPERERTDCLRVPADCKPVGLKLPPGQWPGGTGGSPVLPVEYDRFGLVETHHGNVLDPASLTGGFGSIDAVIHLVGIISEIGRNTFEAVHTRGTQNIVTAARNAGVRRFIHMSALGVRPGAVARYHQSKWAAEEIVRHSGLDWTIFRPSIIYGPGDQFVNLFARLSRFSPILPVMGTGQARLQPVPVADVGACFVRALNEPKSVGQTYDLCGPDALSFDEVLDAILLVTGRKRLRLHIPMPVARLQARVFEFVWPRLLGQPSPLNRDQLLMLAEDNVGNSEPANTLFHLTPVPFRAGIASYIRGAPRN